MIETCCGRLGGWELYLEGSVLGELVQPEYDEMFWVSYRLVPASTSARAMLERDRTWERLRYWSKAMGEFAQGQPFPAGLRAPLGERVSMRRLYLLPASRWEALQYNVATWLLKGQSLPPSEAFKVSTEIRPRRLSESRKD
jgi:hypothetical protein